MKKAPAGLDIDEDLSFQRREWVFQRIGWWVLSAFVLAAALGVFGRGPLSQAEAGERASTLWIEYERFIRVGARTRIIIHATATENGLHLRLNRDFLEGYRLEGVTPEPAAIEPGPSVTGIRFDPPASGATPFTIILDLEPLQAGRHTASVASGDGARASFRQLAYF